MNVDIENIASKKQPFWRQIYEVIANSYFEENIISNHLKSNVEIIHMKLRTYQIQSDQFFLSAMEQGLYEQMVMVRRRESDDKKEKLNTNKYNFQGK